MNLNHYILFYSDRQHIKKDELQDASQLYSDLMDLIVQMASHGVIHSDFNEFNIMITKDEKPVVIDFPQMVSISHENAKT